MIVLLNYVFYDKTFYSLMIVFYFPVRDIVLSETINMSGTIIQTQSCVTWCDFGDQNWHLKGEFIFELDRWLHVGIDFEATKIKSTWAIIANELNRKR